MFGVCKTGLSFPECEKNTLPPICFCPYSVVTYLILEHTCSLNGLHYIYFECGRFQYGNTGLISFSEILRYYGKSANDRRFDNWTEPGRGTRGFPITRPVRTVVRVTTGSQKIKR